MENAYAEETKFLSEKRRKKVDFASFLPTKQGQKKLCHTSSDKKSQKLWFKII